MSVKDICEAGGPFEGERVPMPVQIASHAFGLTDVGNAERFARDHGSGIRYCAALGGWYAWDGRRWAQDRDGAAERLAVETVRGIYGEAERADDKQRAGLALHAVRSEAQQRIKAMLDLAKSMRPLATTPEMFDGPASDYLLNVQNGTLDLRTGELRKHRPEDGTTRLAPVTFDPDARSAAWDAFLTQQVPDSEVRTFLARAAGYTLTGDTREEVLLFVHGPEASGKSTLMEALKGMLGDYAATCPFESFLRRRGDAGVRDDIARLAGVRMALSQEVDEGRAFDVAAVKSLTGGDTVTARHLYGRYFEFRPAFKLWLGANTRPHASAQDAAVWRRVLLVPFERTVPQDKRDKTLKAMLTSDPGVRQAILAWALTGCREWQRLGLRPPKAVIVATQEYRDACDDVGRFLADEFDPAPREIAAGEMQSRYTDWCVANGERRMSAKRLADGLRQHGLTGEKAGSTRLWRWPNGTRRTPQTPASVTSTYECTRKEVFDSDVRGVLGVPTGDSALGLELRHAGLLPAPPRSLGGAT